MDHPDAHCASSLEEALAWLSVHVQPGDVVLTLGAGDGNKVGQWLLDSLGAAGL
jgi:UDP-N-acetylmuramate--alanine ligase